MSISQYRLVFGRDLGDLFWVQDQLNLRLSVCICVTYKPPDGKIIVKSSRPMRGFPERQYDRRMSPDQIVESYLLECVFS
jgi:hypothetical protein